MVCRSRSKRSLPPMVRISHASASGRPEITRWRRDFSSRGGLRRREWLCLSICTTVIHVRRSSFTSVHLLIGLSTGADPGHQAIPASWPTDLAGLNSQIYTYTRDLVTSFASHGTPIDFIELGNEINDGLLWPVGRISVNGFQPASGLLHSAALGVRAASKTTKTVIHIANGWDSSGVNFFYDGIFVTGALSTSDVDVQGFSSYPFYGTNATLDNLKSTLTGMINTFNKVRFTAYAIYNANTNRYISPLWLSRLTGLQLAPHPSL